MRLGAGTVIVYTTVIGRTDPLHEPVTPDGYRFVCFTDQSRLRSRNWEIHRVKTTDAPNRQSHAIKQLAHRYFPGEDWTLWIDAAFTLLVSPRVVLNQANRDVMGFRHPDRSRITQEADAIVRAKKGLPEAVYSQLQHYKNLGWDTDENPQGCITNGGFLLRKNTAAVVAFNEVWHQEVQTRCLRDQMSIDFVAHQCGVKIGYFPGNVRSNPFAQLHVMPGKQVTDF
jgi:hypothetical protein